MLGTRQAAKVLGVKPTTLSRAVWDGRLQQPVRAPGGAFIWSDEDLRRAAWVMRKQDLDDLRKEGVCNAR